MSTPAIRCHYEVFCPDNAPAEPASKQLLAALSTHAKWKRVTQKSDPNRWVAPSFIAGDMADVARRPTRVTGQAVQTLDGLMKKLSVCFVIWAEGPAGKTSALQAALSLATATCGEAGGELVVDRTASIGFMPEHVLDQTKALNAKGDINPGDGVTTSITKSGKAFTLTTSGLSKYGSRDVVLADLAENELDEAVDLFYRQLFGVAVGSGFMNGQTIQYATNDPTAKLFVAFDQTHARISDCDPKRAAAVPGLKKYFATRPPPTSSKPPSKK